MIVRFEFDTKALKDPDDNALVTNKVRSILMCALSLSNVDLSHDEIQSRIDHLLKDTVLYPIGVYTALMSNLIYTLPYEE